MYKSDAAKTAKELMKQLREVRTNHELALEDNRYDPAVQLEEADWEADSTERLMAAMGKLDARSQAILARRWLAEDKATLHELAAEYGVSAERIRQLEKNAMEKIKATLTA